VSRIIRWVLTVALLVGVYRETGPFTTAALGLIFVAVECLSAVLRRILDHEPHR
jgi:hypothetical protein